MRRPPFSAAETVDLVRDEAGVEALARARSISSSRARRAPRRRIAGRSRRAGGCGRAFRAPAPEGTGPPKRATRAGAARRADVAVMPGTTGSRAPRSRTVNWSTSLSRARCRNRAGGSSRPPKTPGTHAARTPCPERAGAKLYGSVDRRGGRRDPVRAGDERLASLGAPEDAGRSAGAFHVRFDDLEGEARRGRRVEGVPAALEALPSLRRRRASESRRPFRRCRELRSRRESGHHARTTLLWTELGSRRGGCSGAIGPARAVSAGCAYNAQPPGQAKRAGLEVMGDVTEALRSASHEQDVRVIVIAAPAAFSAGNDLGQTVGRTLPGPTALRRLHGDDGGDRQGAAAGDRQGGAARRTRPAASSSRVATSPSPPQGTRSPSGVKIGTLFDADGSGVASGRA